MAWSDFITEMACFPLADEGAVAEIFP